MENEEIKAEEQPEIDEDQETVVDTADIQDIPIDSKRDSEVVIFKWTILIDSFLQMSYCLYLQANQGQNSLEFH